MSDLSKFQRSENWRQKLREHLLMERKPQTIIAQKADAVVIRDDFRKLLEEKKISSAKKNNKREMDGTMVSSSRQKTENIPQEDSLGASWQHVSDESFEVMEKMCDKTASDPNSTLFRYMHSENKENIIEEAKRSLEDGMVPIKVYCDGLGQLDVTQLEDIEAPSRLWENTISNETTLQISPCKMIGLLRPSTIVEECGEESTGSNISSQISYETAVKGTQSEASTSCYNTANETCTTNQGAVDRDGETEDLMKFEDSHDLIDLETVFNEGTVLDSSSDRSIIEVSDDENMLREDFDSYESDEKENLVLGKHEGSPPHFNDTLEEVEYMMKKGMEFMAANKNETHSKPTSNALRPSNTNAVSPFTPQMDYLKPPTVFPAVQSGNPNLRISPTKGAGSHVKSCHPTHSRNFLNSPSKRVASPCNTIKEGTKKEFQVKQIPKLDLFKVPTTTLCSSRKMQFSHIASPVGLYMKHTAETPLMTNSGMRKKSNDILTSTAFRELEVESRKYEPYQPSSKCDLPNSLLNGVLSLPKKAYICSKSRHIVDDRTEITIPGGNHIKKYLQQVMQPTVVRHDGKLKSAEKTKKPSVDRNRRHAQRSLENLSLMSGDVSLWTIKDAKKL